MKERMRSRHLGRPPVFALLMAAALAGLWAGSSLPTLAQTNKAPARASSPGSASHKRVDVNSASLKTIETLPGITPSLAQKIVEGRPYSNLDDLSKVKGLSKSKINGIKDHISFGSTTASTSKATTKKKTATGATQTQETPSTAKARKSGTQPESASPTPTGRTSGTSKLQPGETININSASKEDLEKLPGIGPSKAQAILDYRQQHGDFQSIEDIQKVSGIKQGEFSKIKEMIKVNQ